MTPHAPLPRLLTERLLLRSWTEADRAPFAELNADPTAMAFFPAPLTRHESDQLIDRFESVAHTRGYGVWAVERQDSGEFIGCVGLHHISVPLPEEGQVEILWRLHPEHWHQGYATEAASKALQHGLHACELPAIWAMTAEINTPSRAVMARVGMQVAGTFEHPRLPEGHPLRPHVLARSEPVLT